MSNEARKGVLVLDMPEKCSKCQFLYEFQGIKKCQLMNVLYKGVSKLSQQNFTMHRYDKCPLRELLKKKEATKYMNEKEKGYCEGWNVCIDILETSSC